MNESKHGKPNRLANETSPYLLQHAYNPVDWYPWGEDALTRAREEDRPVFLSIGYSACHWCHVMEHESFENADISKLMTDYFVCIKVDREERPDLDQIYMNSVQLITGRGGWPLSVFLTPELKPFFGGTYWPPVSRMGMPGFGDILHKVHEAWVDRRQDILQGADDLTAAVIRSATASSENTELNVSLLDNATRELLQVVDRNNGGFGDAPKFPHPMDIRVLLRAWKRFGNEDALAVAKLTLDKMAHGGIYDHLGGGFHRYATDARWLVPHFEKMLYDNALLASTYLEAYQATGDTQYARVVRETLDYALREMTQPEGGFYSTQDADSEGIEGKFFVWNEQEVVDHLGSDDAYHFNYCYDVTSHGNWEGHNILNRIKPHAVAAQLLDTDEHQLEQTLTRCRQTLLNVRSTRVWPGRDDKVLVSWNGLMIAAMAQAAQVLGEDKYAQAASGAANFILKNMRTAEGRLLHSFKDGRARFNAYLDDYACLIDGLIDVYQASFDAAFLSSALELAELMIRGFHDVDRGGFFYTSADHEQLIARNKDGQDNATPSGNGMVATCLLRLSRICGRPDLQETAITTLQTLSGQMANIALASGQSLIATDFLLGPTHEVVVVDGDHDQDSAEVLETLHCRFVPNKVVLRRPNGISSLPDAVAPLLNGKSALQGSATTYLCENGSCQTPVVGVDGLETALDSL